MTSNCSDGMPCVHERIKTQQNISCKSAGEIRSSGGSFRQKMTIESKEEPMKDA